MSEQDRLAQALGLVKAGNREEAQKIVGEVIRADRSNARAWILMAKIVDDPEKALQCWQEVARLKPDDPRVQEEIAKLKGEPAPQTQPPVRPLSTDSFQPPIAPTAQPFITAPVQSVAPTKQKKRISRPLLVGGALVAVLGCCYIARLMSNLGGDATQTQAPTSTAIIHPTDEPAPPTDTAAPPTATLEPYPNLVATITEVLGECNREGVQRIASISLDDATGLIVVQWALNDNFGNNLIRVGAQKDTMDILQAVAGSGLTYTAVRCNGTFSLVDKYGNASEKTVVNVFYGSETIAKINWDNMLRENIWDIANSALIHPDLQEQE